MAGPRYVAAAPDTLIAVALDSLTAVYHRTSGMTHLLDAPAPQILEALSEPMALDALLDRLAERYELGDADPQALAERLAELQHIGLVWRA